jgi:DUF4097 and DUF4098 domain-containing protein YvlB
MTQTNEIQGALPQMKRAIGIWMFCAGALLAPGALRAQDTPERATVPLQDPAHPPVIHAYLINGGIIVRGADRTDVLVEARSHSGEELRERRPARADGMKRLDLPASTGLDVTEDNNVINIRTSPSRAADLTVTVPRHSSLQLRCMNGGDIFVEQVDGDIEAENLNGKITLKNVAGSVVAHSLNGEVTASLDRIDATKPMSFSTLNGDIDVTLPENLKATVRMKTDHGEIYSDFEVKLDAQTHAVENEAGRRPDGRYHLRFDSTIRGTINGGGAEYQFTTFNGQIYIRKKK